jgi:hypothetical protein
MMGVVTGHAGGPAAPAPSQQSAAKPVPGRHVDGPAWVAIIPALITLIVTIYQIQRPSLWRDEGATLATDLPSRLLALGLPWLVLPPAVLLAASAAHPVYSLRYIVFCVPAVALLAGAGLASFGWAGGAVGLALIVLVALPGQIRDRRAGSHSENLRQLSRLVAVNSRPGDALLFPRLNDREFEAAYPVPVPPRRPVPRAHNPHPRGHPPRHPGLRPRYPQPPHHRPPPLGHRDRQRTRQSSPPQRPRLAGIPPLDCKRHLASALHPPRLRQAERLRAGRRPKRSRRPPDSHWQCGRADSAFLLPRRWAVLAGVPATVIPK